MTTERALFLNKFFTEPLMIGSITPSSSFLAKKMLESLPWEELDVIVELGAGTGVFTDYIARHKKPACRVLVIEQDAQMRESLRRRHPDFFYGSRAERTHWFLEKYNLPKADCIVSGLPFANFSEMLRDDILLSIDQSLQPAGQLVAFQYSLQMKSLLKKQFASISVGFELFNFPPAFIYRCHKENPDSQKASTYKLSFQDNAVGSRFTKR